MFVCGRNMDCQQGKGSVCCLGCTDTCVNRCRDADTCKDKKEVSDSGNEVDKASDK